MPKDLASKSSELPYEILSAISYHLPVEDILSCTTVSRAWNGPFQDSLWRCMTINRQKTLATILNQVTNEEVPYRNSDSYVRSLHIREKARLDNKHIYILQRRFQKLKDLYIRTYDPAFLHIETPVDWSLWESLTDFSIAWMALGGQSLVKDFLEAISHLPNLTRLDLSITADIETHIFTWKDLEALHGYLPHLQDLTLTAKFAEIKDEDIRHIFFASQAITLQKVCFGYGSWKPFWVLYILRKYPRMHTLEWRAYSNNSLSHMDQFELMLILPSLPHAAQYLETINIQTCADILNQLVSNGVMLQVNRRVLKDIKEACFSTVGQGNQNDFYILNRELLRQFLFSNSAGLESFTLDIRNTRNTPIPWSDFHACRSLSELNVHALETIALNDILDHCISLRKLKLKCRFATYGGFVSDNHPVHGLRVLEIEDTNISDKTFKFLVLRCKQLVKLKLDGVKIKTVFPLENSGVSFDMSSLCLQSLELINVRFHRHATTFYETESKINCIALYPQNRIAPSEAKDTNCIWIYQSTHSESQNNQPHTRLLENEEAIYCRKYFDMYQKDTIDYVVQQSYTSSDRLDLTKTNIEINLSTGYISMLYRHIDRLIIDNLILENTNTF
ncbi:hypothetical protein CLU79DRAFT_831876 [Phycomyces nitens]|nr:hypothetical protein CLU79DRAFT_831876 [Phycomyces nitens]